MKREIKELNLRAFATKEADEIRELNEKIKNLEDSWNEEENGDFYSKNEDLIIETRQASGSLMEMIEKDNSHVILVSSYDAGYFGGYYTGKVKEQNDEAWLTAGVQSGFSICLDDEDFDFLNEYEAYMQDYIMDKELYNMDNDDLEYDLEYLYEELEKRTSFNIKPSIWKTFKKKAKKNNSDASKELRKLIENYIK